MWFCKLYRLSNCMIKHLLSWFNKKWKKSLRINSHTFFQCFMIWWDLCKVRERRPSKREFRAVHSPIVYAWNIKEHKCVCVCVEFYLLFVRWSDEMGEPRGGWCYAASTSLLFNLKSFLAMNIWVTKVNNRVDLSIMTWTLNVQRMCYIHSMESLMILKHNN